MSSPVLDVLSTLRLEDGELWADRAADWQLADALGVLEGDRPYSFLTRGRGGSKTTDGAACALAWLLTARAGARGYLAASDKDQAGLALDSIRGFLDRSPSLRAQVEVTGSKVAAASGASVEVLPADASSSWGLRPELLIVDEFAWWNEGSQARTFWESISSAVAKSSTARMLVITSPSSPGHFSYKVLKDARKSELWRVSERTGLVPWLDRARVEEQRRRLPEAQYRRLFLGEWCEGEESLAASGDVDACIAHSGPLEPVHGVQYVIGADLGLKRDRTVCTVCHMEGERVVLDRIAVWQGSRLKPVNIGEVEEWIEQASRSYRRAPLVCDPWQAISLIQRLRERGVQAEEFTFSQQSTSKLAGTMLDLLRGGRLALPDDADLLDELRNVRLVEKSPGNFRIDHARGKHDDRVIALALAAHHLLSRPRAGKPMALTYEPGRGLFERGSRQRVKLHPSHDGSREHKRWVKWRHSATGEVPCAECAAAYAAEQARDDTPRPEPVKQRIGRFDLTPKK